MKKNYLTLMLVFLLLISLSFNIKLYYSLNSYKEKQNQINLHLKGSISVLGAIMLDTKFNDINQTYIPISEKIYALGCYSTYRNSKKFLEAFSKLDYTFKNYPSKNIISHKSEIGKALDNIAQNPSDDSALKKLTDIITKIESNQ